MDDSNEDPAVVGVPPETPQSVRPSATGLVTGPVDSETNVVVAEPGLTEEEQAALAAGGEYSGDADDGAPLIEGPNSE
ncbi:MAG: hypothetical protein ACR2HP_09370 [Ilumatobacteraceae bacterium]